jgi:hypothetical protein
VTPALKSLAALVGATAMIAAAVVGRGALDTKKERDDLRITVACDPVAQDFCRAAAVADSRLTIRVEPTQVTTKTLVQLPPGAAPDFQAWVSVGPWLQMADGKRSGQPPLQKDVLYVASTPLVLVTRTGGNLATCGKPAAGCLPLATNPVGLPSPKSSGIGLAGLAQIVLAKSAVAKGDLDRNAIESGPAADAIGDLAGRTNPGAGLEQLNVGFSQANPLITTQALAGPAAGRANIVQSEPAVGAVLQIGILDANAKGPLGSESAGRALADAARAAGWGDAGDPTGGLPDPGVLAALQDAWPGQ